MCESFLQTGVMPTSTSTSGRRTCTCRSFPGAGRSLLTEVSHLAANPAPGYMTGSPILSVILQISERETPGWRGSNVWMTLA